VKVSSTISNKF